MEYRMTKAKKIEQEELRYITIGSTREALTIDGLKNISLTIPPQKN
jgi:restriction endonuclease S subunit